MRHGAAMTGSGGAGTGWWSGRRLPWACVTGVGWGRGSRWRCRPSVRGVTRTAGGATPWLPVERLFHVEHRRRQGWVSVCAGPAVALCPALHGLSLQPGTEPGSAEPRRYRTRRCRTWRCRASLRVDGPCGAGRGGTVRTSRCAATEARPRPGRGRSDRPTPGSVRACFTWNIVRTVGWPIGAEPPARGAHAVAPGVSLCVASTTARSRPRPTRPVLGRRPAGAEPVVVRIRTGPPPDSTRRHSGDSRGARSRSAGGRRTPVLGGVPRVSPRRRRPVRSPSGRYRRSSGDARPTPARRPLRHTGFGRARGVGRMRPSGDPPRWCVLPGSPTPPTSPPVTAIEPRGEWTTILPVHGAKVGRAARFPVRATRSSSASGRWSSERRRAGDRRLRHAGPAPGDRSRRRRARPMFHVKPHGCGSTWNIAQPCRAAARSTSAR